MSTILRVGQVVRGEMAGLRCEVGPLLGAGGQGEVYRANLSGQDVALKWYYPEWAKPGQRAALETLTRKKPPHPMFLWPIDLVSLPGVSGFGYVMPLREQRFTSGVDLAKKRIDPPFRVIATAGLNLAHGFLLLHTQGLAYRDISFGNVFLDPRTGEVLICDLDNVGVDGRPHNDVGGTMQFMAPEIIRGEANPSAQTDLHSLAVLLFYMFFMGHPLEGAREAAYPCLNEAAYRDLYGHRPLFVADQADKSNRPVRGRHDNVLAFWPVYPPFLKELFGRAFTAGLNAPAGRVRESEWRAAMLQLRDAIIYCPKCGAENFMSVATGGSLKSGSSLCWGCQAALPLPPVLRIGSHLIALNHNTRLEPHHLSAQPNYDLSAAVAEVRQHPTNPNLWGLCNRTKAEWQTTDAAGNPIAVPPDRSVQLAAGTRIKFGPVEGEVLVQPAS